MQMPVQWICNFKSLKINLNLRRIRSTFQYSKYIQNNKSLIKT
jgi:hypothetical protein